MRRADPLISVWTRARERVMRRLFLDRQAAFWLGELDPVRSLTAVRARVEAVVDETSDTKSFVLRPNARWRSHRAGQYTVLEVEIDGVRVRRCYSISSAPGELPIVITVKRVPDGRVSSWLHEHARPGLVVGLSPAAGDFVLPSPAPARLLLLSGGSGITPVMSMVRELAARGTLDDVVFVHHARSRADVIFADELAELDRQHPGLRLVLCLDDEGAGPPGFDESRLARVVPDYAARATYLCGPPGLMERVDAMWTAAGAVQRLAREQFVASPGPTAPASDGQKASVTLTRSGRRLEVDGAGSLLEQLERAGETPASGCRMGICHTCSCRKTSGTVQNAITGEVSSAPDEEIRLCVSVARSELELEL